MNKRWGSYLATKKVILNPELIKASSDCIDYVITHELCHVIFRDHTKEYYEYLFKMFPNWKKVKEKLELRFL